MVLGPEFCSGSPEIQQVLLNRCVLNHEFVAGLNEVDSVVAAICNFDDRAQFRHDI